MFLLGMAFLLTSFHAGYSLTSTGQDMSGGQLKVTCEELAAELAKFKDVSTVWGTSKEGDPHSSTTHRSAEGGWFTEGVTIYRSKSRFNKHVRQINEDREGMVSREPLLDEKGRQIGWRVVKEMLADGKVTYVFILLITDRKVQAISASSLKLALSAEKANVCRMEAERRLTRG
jgi:hypothetical protein